MQIFAHKSHLPFLCTSAVLFLSGTQVSHAQNATDFIHSGDGATERSGIQSGPFLEAAVTEGSRETPKPTPSKARRPMPTGSNLLPSPAVFSRQADAPEETFQTARNTDQQTQTKAQNTVQASPIEQSDSDTSNEREVFRLTNEVRAAAGLPALDWDENLAKAARHHAADMEADGYFDHDTHDRINGQLVRVCSAQERMGLFSPTGAGENIAQGQRNAEEVMHTWLNSPPHRRGMLRPDVRTIGIGKVGRHWVQNFGW